MDTSRQAHNALPTSHIIAKSMQASQSGVSITQSEIHPAATQHLRRYREAWCRELFIVGCLRKAVL